jgi:hypothetical protein
MFKCDLCYDKYMTCALLYSGNVVPKDVSTQLPQYRLNELFILLIGIQLDLRFVLITHHQLLLQEETYLKLNEQFIYWLALQLL